MIQHIFIGVDGGATKSVVRVEDSEGSLLGTKISGPASIRISVDQAWQSINTALDNILQPLAIPLDAPNYQFHVGMGLAGCELAEAHRAFLQGSHKFHTLLVSSDAHTACLGAHNGADGAIIIAGTGVSGYQIEKGNITKVSGWGFPHDDDGSGAWLGMQAVKITLKWLDGRLPESGLARALYTFFAEDRDRLVSWANHANSTSFAELAPLVIEQNKLKDKAAVLIMQEAALAIDQIGAALFRAQRDKDIFLPCSLLGGVASSIAGYLGEDLRKRLRSSQATPDKGAILLVRDHLKKKEYRP